ncbi:MAG: hypothetical protein HY561_02055 [Gemmatimonadetes bacterium]|nr:hypothetical protein [Gemmatimonadota bacterium]
MPITDPTRATLALAVAVALAACAPSSASRAHGPTPRMQAAPGPDPRVGLRAGLYDAGEASWNLRLLSTTPPTGPFAQDMNSDLAFTGHYAIQGNFNGFQVWDISDPARPTLVTAYYCPASQSDVSVHRHLLFVSGESLNGRLDCGGQGVADTVSAERLRGIRIFDIGDVAHPRYIANVQTCRGSHTHSVLDDPRDRDNVYIYVSGSAPVRSPSELAGCVGAPPEEDPRSALFRIEVIRVPLARPEQAAIVSSPRIFTGLAAPPVHGDAPEDMAGLTAAPAAGAFTARRRGREIVLSPDFIAPLLDSMVAARGGRGAPTAADSAALRGSIQGIVDRMFGERPARRRTGPTQCHDITLYPAIGLAGGACGGYGLLLDIRDPAQPVRIDAAADFNFAYWHSATFNNDGTRILFSDEWGGGTRPRCRSTDKPEWGADAIFTLADGKMRFQSYYKLPAPQTEQENCVAHNGSLIPIPGRDVMVQGWYQGGVSVFDWTDPAHPQEIAFFDRGPVHATQLVAAGSWSAYWYNGVIVSSEIARGLDIFELVPSPFLSQNEIDAAKTVRLETLNVQGQPRFVWPPSFALVRAVLDQLERSNGLGAASIAAARQALERAERAGGAQRANALTQLAAQLDRNARGAADAAKVRKLAGAVRELAAAQ